MDPRLYNPINESQMREARTGQGKISNHKPIGPMEALGKKKSSNVEKRQYLTVFEENETALGSDVR